MNLKKVFVWTETVNPAFVLPQIKFNIARSFSGSIWCFTFKPGLPLNAATTFFSFISVPAEASKLLRSITALKRSASWRTFGGWRSAPLYDRAMFRKLCWSGSRFRAISVRTKWLISHWDWMRHKNDDLESSTITLLKFQLERRRKFKHYFERTHLGRGVFKRSRPLIRSVRTYFDTMVSCLQWWLFELLFPANHV